MSASTNGIGPHGHSSAVSAALLLLRIAVGMVFLYHGCAIFLVHIQHGFDIGKGGMEYALTQLLVALALLITGGGKYSLAEMLPRGLRKL